MLRRFISRFWPESKSEPEPKPDMLTRMQAIANRLEASIHALSGGEHETVELLEGFFVAKRTDVPQLYQGQLIWKITDANDYCSYYLCTDWHQHGVRHIRRSKQPLPLDEMNRLIESGHVVRTNEIHRKQQIQIL